jgi:hypothetical protein
MIILKIFNSETILHSFMIVNVYFNTSVDGPVTNAARDSNHNANHFNHFFLFPPKYCQEVQVVAVMRRYSIAKLVL